MLCICLMQHSTFKENWQCLVFVLKSREKRREQTDFTVPLFALSVFSFITLMSTNTCNLTIYNYLHYLKKKRVTELEWQHRNP